MDEAIALPRRDLDFLRVYPIREMEHMSAGFKRHSVIKIHIWHAIKRPYIERIYHHAN